MDPLPVRVGCDEYYWNMENRRHFLKKFSLLGGVAAAGSLPATAAVEWLRTTADPGKGTILQLDPDPGTGIIEPLCKIKITAGQTGTVRVYDGKSREYFRGNADDPRELEVGGALGNQLVVLFDKKGKPVDYTTFQVDCRTLVKDGSGTYGKLLDMLYYTMTSEWGREAGVARYDGKYYHQFVDWLRDHVHTLKGMKYYYPELKTGIALYADSQRDDGMIWDNYNKRPPEGDYWEQRFDYGDFVRVVDDGKREFRRIPVENDVEYLFIEGIYYTWKACGDDRWMEGMLDHALRALKYSTTDPYRWSEKHQLLKRGYTIDTWDFQNDEDAAISTGPGQPADPMVIKLPYTRFGIMFGDNTGMAAACGYLAEMLEHAGRNEEADKTRKTGQEIRERLDRLSWNGRFFIHHVSEDPGIIRDLGVDEKEQVSLSNAYSLNRGVDPGQARAIIDTYKEIRERMPSTSPGEWYTIFPPFGTGYSGHNSLWNYMNGGVTSIVAGELAHGAFEHGEEAYGVDVLNRVLELAGKTGGYLHCTYRGAMEAEPGRSFTPLPLDSVANTDTRGNTVEGVAGWTGEGENDLHEFPTGKQVFHDIPFQVTDPAVNGRKACLGLSSDDGYVPGATLKVNAKASSIYFLHTTNRSYYAGSIILHYQDGTSMVDAVGPGKISNWWYPTVSENLKQTPVTRVAWKGKNRFSRSVGVCLYGLDNPHPEKTVNNIRFQGAGNSTKWMVMGVTLSDHPVFFMPDMVSAGIPDNWGAAAVVYALVEGLCGVKDRGVAFDHTLLAPRWPAAGESRSRVTIKYPASGGYVSYSYLLEKGFLQLTYTGNHERSDLTIMLPEDREIAGVKINDREVPYGLKDQGTSRYVVVEGITAPVNRVLVEFN
jgi:hypothetical protein